MPKASRHGLRVPSRVSWKSTWLLGYQCPRWPRRVAERGRLTVPYLRRLTCCCRETGCLLGPRVQEPLPALSHPAGRSLPRTGQGKITQLLPPAPGQHPGPAPPCLSPGPPGPGWAVRANSRHSIHDPALPVSKCAAAAQEWRLISPPGGSVTRCQLCAPRTVRWGLTGIFSEAWSPPSPQCAPSRHPHSTSPPGKFRGCRVVGGGHAQVQREASPVLETRAGLGGG